MSKNTEIADIFERIADALEFKSENIFKIAAYRRAARVLREYHGDLDKAREKGTISNMDGIGKGMAEKIEEYLLTGKIKKYGEVISDIPEGLLELLNRPNLGPKTLYLIYKELGVKNLEQLERAAKDESIAALTGMGSKKAANIRKGISLYKSGKSRTPLGIALAAAEELISPLKKITEKVSAAGSLRRMKETVGDIDILASGADGEKIIEAFVSHPAVKNITARGETKVTVILETRNMQADLRVVEKNSYGSALVYFTGSKAHNVKIRGLAKDKGFKVNEYGVFRGDDKIAGKTEEEVYKTLGMKWIPPEIREDRGEIEASIRGKLPHIIEGADLKGDLHVHSNYSDGTVDIKTIVLAAKKMGYEYIGICDHSQTSRIAGGLDEEMLKKRNAEIDEMQEQVKGIKILKGMEVDILSDGRLDYPDIVLEELDFIIAAVHQGFAKNVTHRMKTAMENPFVDIIAHPTGRLLSGREGYAIELEDVMEHAAKKRVALEINASIDRMDLNDINILKGKDFGARFAIGTDAHNTEMLGQMKLGTGMARRGWLEKKDVLNTFSWKDMPLRRRR